MLIYSQHNKMCFGIFLNNNYIESDEVNMKELKNKKVSVFTILIMVLCGLLFAYTIYSFISVRDYLSGYTEAYGSVPFSEQFSYYMSNCFTYIIYICGFLAIWWIRPRKNVNDVASAEMDNMEVEEVEKIEEVTKVEEIIENTEATSDKEVGDK